MNIKSLNRLLESEKSIIIHMVFALLGAFFLSKAIYIGLHTSIGTYNHPLGMDFFSLWSAGKVALTKGAGTIYNVEILSAFQKEYLQLNSNYSVPWFYPPLLLLYISLFFALLPYKLAYFIYLALNIGLYIWIARTYFKDIKWLWLFSIPALWIGLLAGQNGILMAALFIVGLMESERRPILAGICLGLLSFKPQIGLIIPLFLLYSRHYKVFFTAATTVLALSTLSIALFGWQIWESFIETLKIAQNYNYFDGIINPSALATVTGALLSVGAPYKVAIIAHYSFALLCLILFYLILQKKIEREVQFALLILVSMVFAPHLLYYDFIVTAACIWWLRNNANKILLILLWLAPLIAGNFADYGIAYFPLLVLALLTMEVRNNG